MIDPVVVYAMGAFLTGINAFVAIDLLVRAWRDGARLRLLDRWDVLNKLLGVVITGAFALFCVPWTQFPVAVWYVLVVLCVVAFGGAALRWPALPWSAGDTRARTRRISAVGYGAAVAVIAVLLLVV